MARQERWVERPYPDPALTFRIELVSWTLAQSPNPTGSAGRARSGDGEKCRVEDVSGQTFGSFEIVRELGHGATGTVYLARQTNLGRECALKVLAPQLVKDEKFLERFRREGQIAAALRHPNIVRLFDLVEHEGSYAIAMDFIDGVELQRLLERKEKFSVTRSLSLMVKVLGALEYAHSKGVIHRDIKPANIMIENDGDVFLTDFSVARMAGTEKLTQTGTVIGTPEYMAPEQFDGKEVDARVDLYAAVLILYEMLSGVNPFSGETLAEVVKKQVLTKPPPIRDFAEVPEALERILAKGLAKAPEDRFQSATELKEILEHFLNDQSTNLIEPAPQSEGILQNFLASVEAGDVSMDEAIQAREMVKEAIDRGFKRRLSIVMLDLAGSSRIKVPNQTLIADRAFRDYRSTINGILEKYGCESCEWSGDGAIALFGEPVPAVRAAVDVQREVCQVGRRHADLPDALKVRIGIRTGLVYHDPRRGLGEFASRTVDQAGHLEKDCPPGKIHIGDETARAVEGLFPWRSVGVNRDDIEVFEISVEEPAESPQPRPAPIRSQHSAPAPAKVRPPVASESPPAPARPEPAQKPPSMAQAAEAGGKSGPWWGWRSMGFLFFMAFSTSVLVEVVSPEWTSLFIFLFLLHLCASPFITLYQLFQRRWRLAGQSCGAFFIFFVGLVICLRLVQGYI